MCKDLMIKILPKILFNYINLKIILYLCKLKMVNVAQLVRAPDCGSGGRGFKSHLSPKAFGFNQELFLFYKLH